MVDRQAVTQKGYRFDAAQEQSQRIQNANQQKRCNQQPLTKMKEQALSVSHRS
jgi:hypothetical protein